MGERPFFNSYMIKVECLSYLTESFNRETYFNFSIFINIGEQSS